MKDGHYLGKKKTVMKGGRIKKYIHFKKVVCLLVCFHIYHDHIPTKKSFDPPNSNVKISFGCNLSHLPT